jgi:endoglucanase
MLTAAAVLLAVAGAIAALSYEGSLLHERRTPLVSTRLASQAARTFLSRYMAADGRVVRRDQGGDTVSEGQAYAMLLAVAIGDQGRFARAWSWDSQHLQVSSGLFAWHWANGAVLDWGSAADADLDTAWALLLAASRFHNPGYQSQALHVAAGILAHETAIVGTKLVLVAGPWARTPRAVVNPSYDSPEALAALAAATSDPRWSQLEANSRSLLQHLGLGRSVRLPPDWVFLDAGGTVRAVATPSGSGQPVYALNAQRVPVWLAASCSRDDKRLAATTWPVLRHSQGNGAAISYSLAGRRLALAVNPLGFVAAAAAADAAGAPHTASHLLNEASAQAASTPTYYGDAWVALGRVLLDTDWLSPCPPPAAG